MKSPNVIKGRLREAVDGIQAIIVTDDGTPIWVNDWLLGGDYNGELVTLTIAADTKLSSMKINKI